MPGVMTELEQATELFRGIVAGVSADYFVNDDEVAMLTQWLDAHPDLVDKRPFKDLKKLLAKILEDGVISPEERVELLMWCGSFTNPSSYVLKSIADSIFRLRGYLRGIAIDGRINEREVRALGFWLAKREQFADCWPYSEVIDKVLAIFGDGKVTDAERQELLEFCESFREHWTQPEESPEEAAVAEEPDTTDEITALDTVAEICALAPKIEIAARSFCFAGDADFGSTADLEAIVAREGGIPTQEISANLDYLVIGSRSDPNWAYSPYGRKVEQVAEYRQQGAETQIIREDDFIAALS